MAGECTGNQCGYGMCRGDMPCGGCCGCVGACLAAAERPEPAQYPCTAPRDSEAGVRELLVTDEVWPHLKTWLESKGLTVQGPFLFSEDSLPTWKLIPKELDR